MTDGKPLVRLRAEYSTASATVAELTRALSKGSVTLETKNPLPVGTRFVFELASSELAEKLEVNGIVTSLVEHGPDLDGKTRYGMLIEYRFESDEERQNVQAAIQQILRADPNEVRREHRRVPTAYRLTEADDPLKGTYTMRDLSEGGMLLESDSPELGGETVLIGTRTRMDITAAGNVYSILGTVVWVGGGTKGRSAHLGVQFDLGMRAIINDLMAMRVTPDSITITFQ